MHAHNPILKHPFIRDGQRYPKLAAVLRALLEIPNIPLAGLYAHLQSLPPEKLHRVSVGLIRIYRRLRKAQSIHSMKAVLGRADWTETQWNALWEENCHQVGLTIGEVMRWEQMSLDEAVECVTISGEEHIREALRGNRGVMLWGTHLGNVLSYALAIRRLRLDTWSAGNAMIVRSFQNKLERFARSCGMRYILVGDRLPFHVGETFRRRASFLTFVDFTLPETRDLWIRLGSTETHVSIGPALLALRHRVPVICLTGERLNAMRHRVTFHPPRLPEKSNDFRADATRLTQQAMDIVATEIRSRPEQWWQWDVVPTRSLSGSECSYGHRTSTVSITPTA